MSEKMRSEFEEWAKTQGEINLRPEKRFSDTHTYYYPDSELAWCAWRESRAALCVELPSVLVPDAPEDAVDDSWMDGPNGQLIMLGKCASAIIAAGVSWK